MTTSESTPRLFSMAELLARTGVPAATIRYYLGLGLLPEPIRISSNRFLYDERHAELLRMIRLVRDRRGLSIDAIGKVLPELLPDLYDKPSSEVFNPAMWDELIDAASHIAGVASVPERIVEAGVTLFCARGFADVSIDDVCKVAEIAKGSFYRHFASKEELFFATAEEAARRVAADLVAGAPLAPIAETELTKRIETAVEPYLVVFLDVASLAAQRRPGYGRTMRTVSKVLSESARALAPAKREPLETAIAQAFVLALQNAISVDATSSREAGTQSGTPAGAN